MTLNDPRPLPDGGRGCALRSSEAVPPLLRRRQGRLVGGVATGLAAPLGVDPAVVRVAFLLLSVAGGVGIGLYALLWALVPETDDAAPPAPGGTIENAAVLAIVAGAVLVLRSFDVWFSDAGRRARHPRGRRCRGRVGPGRRALVAVAPSTVGTAHVSRSA